MAQIKLTYEFEDEAEMRAFMEQRDVEPKAAAPAAKPAAAPATETADTAEDAPTRDSTDADGMPYNEAVHSDPPAFTADGLWRARRGKADEAKAARAAFKASGGDVTPPEDVQTRAEEPAAAPSAPGAAPAAAPAAPVVEAQPPVTLEAVYGKATAMLEAGNIDSAGLRALYKETTGVEGSDDEIPTLAGAVLHVNETARAALMAKLNAI